METSFRFEQAQGAKCSQLVRNRGDPEAIKADLRVLNRESLAQCASDQLTEFAERKNQSKPAFPAYGKGGRRNRWRGRRPDSKDSYGKAHRLERAGTYRRPNERYKKEEGSKKQGKKEDEKKTTG